MSKDQPPDPAPDGQPGYSVYEYVEHARTPTPGGGWVPLFVLVRALGPYPTEAAALRAAVEAGRRAIQAGELGSDPFTSRILPDRGQVYKEPEPGSPMNIQTAALLTQRELLRHALEALLISADDSAGGEDLPQAVPWETRQHARSVLTATDPRQEKKPDEDERD